MAKMGFLGWFSYVLLAIGGLNWGVRGVTDLMGEPFDLVSSWMPSVLANIVFVLVGLAGVYAFFMIPKLTK